ncbi:DUF87 domain-containing protein [Methanosphaera sp. ISO3-F5]|uniref:helicase HerA domain-containing protein n=1 Tax=Methanosphaera sp. ISO3-F5 TaxID=1452353 RepID=UPI002B25B886|nr:DUF87 domain-containing protein [Methanosphaera sp. ISO3-F5]WQH63909.1 DUF87 domain-containing protein [Methanosphaera sp. ISO3-F5]
MSEEFYKYISTKLIDTFSLEGQIKNGDKFFIEFDEKNQVKNLYDNLKEVAINYGNNIKVEPFKFQYNNGNPYETYTITFNSLKLVIASSDNATNDYLVTLRNAVTEQNDVWKDTALLIIGINLIDSIQNGMKDLQNRGMPFNINRLTDNLKSEIYSKDTLNKYEKECLNFHLDNMLNDMYETTLWDYEDVLAIINQGKILEEQYPKLGLFPDSKINQDNHKQTLKKHIKENHNEFERVAEAHRLEEPKDKLEKRYTNSGVTKLNKDNWYETDYNSVKRYINKDKGFIEYDDEYNSVNNEKLIYWEKPEKNNKAGLRKRHIIVFNPDNLEEITLEFMFDSVLSKSFINKKSQKIATTKGKKLIINLKSNPNTTTFNKVTYTHKDISSMKYIFNIAIVNCPEDILKPIKSNYLIMPSKKYIQILNEDNNNLIELGIGDEKNKIIISEEKQEIPITLNDTIIINDDNSLFSESNNLIEFQLSYDLFFKIPLAIKENEEKVIPKQSVTISNYKRENESNFIYNGNKIIQGSNIFSIDKKFKKFLKLEEQIVKGKIFSGNIDINNNIEPEELLLSNEIREKYENILNYYENMKNEKTICGYPSLVYLDDNLEKLYTDFLIVYNKEIENITEEESLSDYPNKFNLSKIGVFKSINNIYYSSLSPLVMAYQIELKHQLKNEPIEESLLNRLTPDNLLPYIYNEDNKIFKPLTQNIAKEWIIYEKEVEVNLGSTNKFIAKVIEDKMNRFIKTFYYLFDSNDPAPLKLNIINIQNDKEIVKGIFNFIYSYIKKSRSIIPVELNIYNNEDKSFFDYLFKCNNESDLEDIFDIKINSKDFDPSDILRIIQNNITYYKIDKNITKTFEYAHISFYKSSTNIGTSNSNMENVETGVYLNGLLSETTAFKSGNNYKVGFGTRNLRNKNNLLLKTAINTNEIIHNTKNNGEDIYSKGKSITIKPKTPEFDDIELLYDKSVWVTFIEPVFGLEYFDTNDNLIIVHYSEQYTSSNKYDTITVSNQNKEYENIIKLFLNENNYESNDEYMENNLKIFNGINGEWLLRVISDNNQINRDKLSIISAIKYILSILHKENIIWIPISLDEINRICKTINITLDSKLHKLLNNNQNMDYILFVGLEYDTEYNVEIVYYPIEINNDIDNSEDLTSNDNIINISYIFNSELLQNSSFKSKFFRNFIMQIALANYKKLSLTDLWNDTSDILDKIKPKLLNDDYNFSKEIKKHILDCAIFNFREDLENIKIHSENKTQLYELPKKYAFEGISDNVDSIIKKMKDDVVVLPEHKFILDNYNSKISEKNVSVNNNENPTTEPIKNDTPDTDFINDENNDINSEKNNKGMIYKPHRFDSLNQEIPLDNIRTLIGTIPHSNKKIFIEYGHKELSNRHVLISGKSGYGKTYFMQCLIYEMSKQKIPTLIIDYSDAFTENELKDEIKDFLGENLKIFNVKKDKFPLNPFRKQFEEDYLDISSKIKSIFSSVYNIGPIQENTLLTTIFEELNNNQENMDFNILKNALMNKNDKNSQSVLSQINEFLLYDPFMNDKTFDWSCLDKRSKDVIIIQLHGYSKNIQKIITEFILWDLWNYKLIYGSEEKPFNIVLDEAQNLDFSTDKSPSVKILKEGRKKGWSAWFATQTINGIIKKTGENPFNIAENIIYFHPTDKIKNVASDFTTNNEDKLKWTEKISNLKKGECIFVGPTKNSENHLNPSRPFYLKIDSLKDRKNND